MRPHGHFFFLESRTTNLLWLGLLGLVVIFFFMLIFEALKIETRLNQQVAERLLDSGYSRARVAVSGRDVMLEGEVSSKQAEQRLKAIALQVEGVRAVHSRVDLVPMRLSHVKLRKGESGWLEISGELPSVETIAELRSQLDLAADAESEGIFVVSHDPEVTEATWLAVVGEAVAGAAGADNLYLEIGAHDFIVGGRVASKVEYSAMMAVLEDIAVRHQIQLVNRLATMPSPTLGQN